jgi:hypothetical protein
LIAILAYPDAFKAVKNFYNNSSNVGGGTSNPWALLLRDLHKPEQRAPKKLPGWIQFAKAEPQRIRDAASSSSAVWKKNKAVKELFEDLPEQKRRRREAKAKAAHLAAKTKHESTLKGEPSLNPEKQQK